MQKMYDVHQHHSEGEAKISQNLGKQNKNNICMAKYHQS